MIENEVDYFVKATKAEWLESLDLMEKDFPGYTEDDVQINVNDFESCYYNTFKNEITKQSILLELKTKLTKAKEEVNKELKTLREAMDNGK